MASGGSAVNRRRVPPAGAEHINDEYNWRGHYNEYNCYNEYNHYNHYNGCGCGGRSCEDQHKCYDSNNRHNGYNFYNCYNRHNCYNFYNQHKGCRFAACVLLVEVTQL